MMEDKRVYTKYVSNIIKTPRPSTHPTEAVPQDHPFYSQYNLLKTTNQFNRKEKRPTYCKKFDLEFSKNCEREFTRFVTYQVRKNCPNYDYENHLLTHTGINLIGKIVRDLPDQKIRGKEVWDLLKQKELQIRDRT